MCSVCIIIGANYQRLLLYSVHFSWLFEIVHPRRNTIPSHNCLERIETHTKSWELKRESHTAHTLCQFSFRAVHFHLYIICIPNWAAHKCKMEWINITESNWASAWLIMSFKWNHSVKLAIVSSHFCCLLSHLWFLWWMTDLCLWVSAHLFSRIKLNSLHAFEWKNEFSHLYVRMGFFC